MAKKTKGQGQPKQKRPEGDSFANRVADAFSEVAGRGMGSIIASLPWAKIAADKVRDLFIMKGIDPNNAADVIRNLAIFSSIIPKHEEAGELLEGLLTRSSEVLRQRSADMPSDPTQQQAWVQQVVEAERKKMLEEGNLPKVAILWSRAVALLAEYKRIRFFSDLEKHPDLFTRFKKESDTIKLDPEFFSKVVMELPQHERRIEFLTDAIERATKTPEAKKFLPPMLQKPYDEFKEQIEAAKKNFDVAAFTKDADEFAKRQNDDVDDWHAIKHGR